MFIISRSKRLEASHVHKRTATEIREIGPKNDQCLLCSRGLESMPANHIRGYVPSGQVAACKQRGNCNEVSQKETPIDFPKDTHFLSPSITPHPLPADSVVLTYLMNFIASGNARAVETNGMVSGLEQKPYAIIAVAGARVYHTKLQEKDHQWNYSRWKGTLSLGRDLDTPESLAQGTSEAEKHWFRLADVESGRTVWMFKFPENFEYELDRPFFHVFQGRVCLY